MQHEEEKGMRLRSIYSHMEKGAAAVPAGENCKLVLRHSIRHDPVTADDMDATLTEEGRAMAQWFGSGIGYEIGHVASSSRQRNIQTCQAILSGKGVEREIAIARDELETPHAQDLELSGAAFAELNYYCRDILHRLKNGGLPGFNPIGVATRIMTDYIFASGNACGCVDLFCTHDFQMAILLAGLFGYSPDDEMSQEGEWPLMLEGMILWGERSHFWCAWRGEVREFINHGIR